MSHYESDDYESDDMPYIIWGANKIYLKNHLRRNKIRSGSENFVFAENFSIGVKLGENRMGESVFGFDHDIT